jgi:manganese/zinc/iron transport system substrate-binding protein
MLLSRFATPARRAAAGAALALFTAACAGRPASVSGAGPVRAVATTGMIADIVERVGGDRVVVTGMMGPGVDPHLYKATPGDVRALTRADIVFYNGLHLEAAMGEVLEEMGERARTVPVSRDIPVDRLLAPPEFAGQYDPHIWFDVSFWMSAVGTVAEALAEADPAGAETYAANARSYLQELAALDAWVRSRIGELPEERRVLVTAHDAFNYFGQAYGVDVLGLQGISTALEAGTGDVQRVADVIVTRRIPAVFVESSIPRRTIGAVQEAVHARGGDVEIGGELFSDAMGNPGTAEGTYVGMIRHNVNTIVNGLLGRHREAV